MLNELFRSHRILGIALLVPLCIALICLPIARLRSEDSAHATNGDSAHPQAPAALTDPQTGSLPTQELVENLSFRDGVGPKSREMVLAGIYPKAGTNDKREYFVRPLLAVLSIETEDAEKPGMKHLIVRYALADQRVCDSARAALQRKWGINAHVWAWPVTGEMVYVLCKRTNPVVAKARATVSSRNEIEFILELPEKEAELVKQRPELYKANVYYSTRELHYAKGTLTISGEKNISMELREVLSSRDPSLDDKDLTGHLVIGDEVSEVERRVAAMLTRVFEAENPNTLPMLEKQAPMLVDQLIAIMGIDEISYDTLLTQMNRDEVEAAFAQYMSPRVKALNSSRAGNEHELKINETSKGENGGFGLSFITGIIGISGGSEEVKRTLERLEKGTGMSWAFNEAEQAFKPHKLKAARVRKGYDTVQFKEQSVVFLPLSQNGGYLVTANVPLTFTRDMAIDSLKDQGLLDGIDWGIGAIQFSLNGTAPGPNWVPLDGVATFPNEVNIPPDLRGKKVPNLQGAVAAVDFTDTKKIGERVDGTLETQTVSGAKYSLPAVTTKQMHSGQGTAHRNEWKGAFVGIFHTNGDYHQVQHNTAEWGCFGGRMIATPAAYEYHPAGTKLEGSVEIKPITHVFMRAYIRIR
jgi:hypothetical protein